MKKSKLILPLVCLLLTLSLASTCYALEATTTLYAHSEGIKIGVTGYKTLKTTACDGPVGSIVKKSAASKLVALGNSSVIELSSIHSRITALNTATWTFSYYAKANETQKTTLLCDILLVYSDGTPKATLATAKGETAVLTASNTTKTGTASITKTSVDPTDYIKVVWYANKTDTANLTITLWLDVSANPTKITGVNYEYGGSQFWNSAVSTIWKVLLPILFVVGIAIRFVAYKEKSVTIGEVIGVAVAFLLVAILIPIVLDALYVA